MPNAAARLATSAAIRPMPTSPSVFWKSSVRLSSFLRNFPSSFMALCASMSLLGTASMRPNASSATATEDAAGVFRTSMPRSLAALVSTLSRPTPPRMMSLSLGAPAIHSAVHLVLERTSATSASGSRAMSSVTSPNFLSLSGSDLSKASQIRTSIATSLSLGPWAPPTRCPTYGRAGPSAASARTTSTWAASRDLRRPPT